VLLIFLPIGFTIMGAIVAYCVGRAQGLTGRALWGQVAGGAFGGLVGGLLTVPFLGTAGAVTVAASAVAPSSVATVVGTATEWTALAVGQAAGSAAGQAATNAVEGEPLTRDLLGAGAIGFGSQLVLAPIGDKAVLFATPFVPTFARTVLASLARVGVSPPTAALAVKEVGGVAVKRLAGESTTEALTDGATMVVPMPGADKKDAKKDGEEAAPAPPAPSAPSSTPGVLHALGGRLGG